jgi:hypothetical protein
MKTLPVLTLAATVAATALLPLNPALFGSALLLLALAPITSADYDRRVAAGSIANPASLSRRERLGLAA